MYVYVYVVGGVYECVGGVLCMRVCVCVCDCARARVCTFVRFFILHVFLRESVRLYVCTDTEEAHDTSRQAMTRPKKPEVIVS